MQPQKPKEVPLEDQIDDAREAGRKVGMGGGDDTANPFLTGTPQFVAWKNGFDTSPKPDLTQYAYEMGVSHAKAGPGFTNPYQPATPMARAWARGYNNTPKGVPQMAAGPQGRSEDEFTSGERLPDQRIPQFAPSRTHDADVPGVMTIKPGDYPVLELAGPDTTKLSAIGGNPVGGSVVFTMPNRPPGLPIPQVEVRQGPTYIADPTDPYTNMLAAAKRQGAKAREDDKPIGSNPYNEPSSRLEGPAEAWGMGWRQADTVIQERIKAAAEETARGAKMWKGPHFETPPAMELVRFEKVTREDVAVEVFSVYLWIAQKEDTGSESRTEWAARMAVVAADDLLAALKK